MASVGIQDEDAAVSEGDLGWLPGFGTLVELLEVGLPVVVWNPFADGLPRWFDGLKRLEIEWRVGWRRETVDVAFAPPFELPGARLDGVNRTQRFITTPSKKSQPSAGFLDFFALVEWRSIHSPRPLWNGCKNFQNTR